MKRPSSCAARHLALAAFLALQGVYFVYFLGQFRYLPGNDSYFYALQTQSLLESGHLKVPDSPVVYYIIATLCRAGLSIEASFKTVLFALFMLYGAGLWGLIGRLKYAFWPLGLLLSVISGPLITFHMIEFPRLSLGLATVPVWFLLLAGVKRGHIWWLMTLIVACSFVHVATLFLGMAFVLAVAISSATVTTWAGLFSAKNGIIAFAGFVVGAAMIVSMWPGFALRLAALRFSVPGIVAFFGHENNVPRDFKIVVPFVWLLLVLILAINSRSLSRKWWLLALVVLGIPLWPGSDPSLFGLSGRLAVLFVFVATPLSLILLGEVPEGRLSNLQSSRGRTMLALIAISLVAVLPLRLGDYRAMLAGDDYDSYEKVVADLRNETIPMLIAHRGLDFFYSYRLRRDAFHFDPEPGWKQSDVWRVAMRITPEEVAYYSPPNCLWGETAKIIPGTGYLLVREDCWEQLRANVNPKNNPDLYLELWEDSENPSELRPAFLRARHRGLSEQEFPSAEKQR